MITLRSQFVYTYASNSPSKNCWRVAIKSSIFARFLRARFRSRSEVYTRESSSDICEGSVHRFSVAAQCSVLSTLCVWNGIKLYCGIPLRAETPLCTRIARSASRKSQRPRRKPAPQVDEFACTRLPAEPLQTKTFDPSTVPPPRPPKHPLRHLHLATVEPGPSLPNQLAGLKPLRHPSPTICEAMHASDNDMPALMSDGDTDSLSSLDAP